MMSLLRTIRPLEQAIAQSRVGRTYQSFTTVVLTWLVRAGAGPWPDRRRHALGEPEVLCLLHIALSMSKTRRSWFTSQSNKALVTVPFASKVVCRRPKPEFRAQHERPGFLRLATTLNNLWDSLVEEPMAQLHGCATQFRIYSVQHNARARGHKRGEEGSFLSTPRPRSTTIRCPR